MHAMDPVSTFPNAATSRTSDDDHDAAAPGSSSDTSSSTTQDDAADTAASAATAHDLVDRAARRAHDAVDAVAARVDALVGNLGERGANLADTRDEWVGAARDAITERPLAAIGIALLVGAGLASLRSSRGR
jgi:ElaB/YqjD/DUF883 family membrane-anchored ribosome-binding protein